jgi:hypothetical protein
MAMLRLTTTADGIPTLLKADFTPTATEVSLTLQCTATASDQPINKINILLLHLLLK